MIKRVTVPILIGAAVTNDNTLRGKRSEIDLPLDVLQNAWLFSIYDDNGKKMRRTRIKIDDNSIYIASISPEEVRKIMEDDDTRKVGF